MASLIGFCRKGRHIFGARPRAKPRPDGREEKGEQADANENEPLESTHPPIKRKGFGRYVSSTWLWEYIAAAGSALAFASLVSVLRHYDGQAVPTFPLGATLNGVISILATVSRAMLLTAIAAALGQWKWLRLSGRSPRALRELQDFDDASRGPLGALVLLFKTKMQTLAVLGAIVTIVSLGFDPFLQSVIHTNNRSIFSEETGASLKQVNTITDPQGYENGLSVPYRDSIINALAGNPPSFDVNATCPSGNCTWPSYTTLRFCNRCANITQWVMQRSNNGTEGACKTFPMYESYDSSGTELVPDGSLTNRYICRYKLPKPFHELASDAWSAHDYYWDTPILLSEGISGAKLPASEAASLLNETKSNLTIALSATVRLNSTLGTPDNYDVHICSWNLCLDTMNTTVYNGVIDARVVNTLKLSKAYVSPIPQNWSSADYQWNSEHNVSLEFAHDAIDMHRPDPVDRLNVTMTRLVWVNLRTNIVEYFTGNHPEEPNADMEILDGMSRATNFIATMDRVAASLTDHARQMSGGSVIGQVGRMETYIVVHWRWIALPAAVLGGGVVFLILTVSETKRRKLEIWKTSTLPLLFNEADWDLDQHGQPNTLYQMERIADATRISLRRNSQQDGWMFHHPIAQSETVEKL